LLDFNVILKNRVRPSVFLEKSVILDDGKPLNFNNYHIYRTLLDLPIMESITFRCSRQVGKSIFIGSNLLKYSFVPHFRSLYVGPQNSQVADFSKLKLGMMLEFSPILREFLLSRKSPYIPAGTKISSDMLVNNVELKLFATAASIKLGYAADADGVGRLRGKSADLICYDEAQSIDLDAVLPVVMPMMESSDYGMSIFSGTPIDIYDPLSVRYDFTTQHTMVVKCESCNRHNTLMDIRQISEKKGGIVCLHCGALLNVANGKFIPMNPGAEDIGFHINRLMFPSTTSNEMQWRKVIRKLKDPNTSETMFIQEVLGVPCNTSTKLLSKSDILAIANGKDSYDPNDFETVVRRVANSRNLVFSIDWGGGAEPTGKNAKLGSASRTCASLWKMEIINGRSKMNLMWHKVYPVENYKESTEELMACISMLPPRTLLTADFGGGQYGNDAIYSYITKIRPGAFFFIPIQLGESDTLARKDEERRNLFINRNKMLTKLFNKVLLKEIVLPTNTALVEEIASHILAEIEYENELGKRIWRKRHGANASDDFLFSMLFAWAAYNWQVGNKQELGVN